MVYTVVGVPLTYVLINHLSRLIERCLQYLFVCMCNWKMCVVRCRQVFAFDSIGKQHRRRSSSICSSSWLDKDSHLTTTQIFIILIVYLLIGAMTLTSSSSLSSLLDRVYCCFTSIFTLHFHTDRQCNVTLLIIYDFIGLSIVLLWMKTVRKQMEFCLKYLTRRSLANVFDFIETLGRIRSLVSIDDVDDR
jgi:hypothetical protein